MRILGIESSCDETAAAVVVSGERVLSSVVASQLDVHARYGGVVPELASREHLRAVTPIVREAVERAGLRYGELDAIAVTSGPGLAGALLVGLTYAKGLAFALGKPLLGVNHLEGHIHAVALEAAQQGGRLVFPALALVVSGGHTHMFRVERDATAGYSYRLLGRTRDDAAGEAFDKVAKLVGLGYPGGPWVDRLSPFGDASKVDLPGTRMKGNPLDWSFSGLKTAVLRWVRAGAMDAEIAARRRLFEPGERPTLDAVLAATPQPTRDLLASFQQRVIEELLARAEQAAEQEQVESILVSGGVAANRGLRERFEKLSLPVWFPSLALSTDNAAMIAAAAWPRLARGERSDWSLRAYPNLRLA
ncbi:MAG: tRNA (adenosine(37)-N6)-threonylcarbamoyltransferase complex transferase subunit TsaD [Acidobacteria bacterium]|nr:tRNA (adenosine(37)-N6)-threonylcarbamoyltransferase complex transferase subunit TsaD [Acidobacteriota bacterium]